jgi:hypothetical protein
MVLNGAIRSADLEEVTRGVLAAGNAMRAHYQLRPVRFIQMGAASMQIGRDRWLVNVCVWYLLLFGCGAIVSTAEENTPTRKRSLVSFKGYLSDRETAQSETDMALTDLTSDDGLNELAPEYELGPEYDVQSGLNHGHFWQACSCGECDSYRWEFLPRDPLYPFYLADTKQSRMAGQWLEATDDATLLDSTLGGRFGIFRYVEGAPGPFRRGVQADFEGAAQVRLDMDQEHDVRAVDFRAGVPISVSFGRLQTRFGYYHLSSHLGDEFLLRNPGYPRVNYSRDVLFIGAAYWLDNSTRIYSEMGWAFYSDVSEPWEFSFGIEEAPRHPTGIRGAPFYAVHGHLREEVDFGGNVTAQLGWAWRSTHDTGLLRLGLHYFNGKSNQYSFYDDHEEMIGMGLWYDF